MKKLVIAAAVTAAVTAASGSITAHAETLHYRATNNYNVNQKNGGQAQRKNNSNPEYGYHTVKQITYLSAMYESNNNPGSISSGVGDFGGKSYGAWQFSSKTGTLGEFINYLKYNNYDFYFVLVRSEFKNSNVRYGKDFDKTWERLAKVYPNTFYNLQMDFIKENYYDKLVRKLRREGGFSKVLSNLAVQNVILSTAVQNGVNGAYQIISPLKYRNPAELIKEIYNRRALTNSQGTLVNFYSSSNQIQNAIKNRLVNEEATALSILNI